MRQCLYTLALHAYAFMALLAAPFNRKARLLRVGQRQTPAVLRAGRRPDKPCIWVHAASLGEFEQGRPVIDALRRRYPQYHILLTFFSPSGYEVRKNYDGAHTVCYLPFDTPRRVQRFLNLARPDVAIFIKYEFWLNYLVELHRRSIPVYLVSAIFRPEQFLFNRYAGWYRRHVLSSYSRLFVQDDASARLLAEYGAGNVSVCGDTRFDRVLEVQRRARPMPLMDAFTHRGEQLVLVAGSTWPTDEEALIPCFNARTGLKLIIAPHEISPERLQHIEAALQRPSVRLSQASEQTVADAHCLIVDSIGQLSALYRYGDIAYIGGGFGKGIHNTLEAAVYGMPVIFGHNYRRFREAVGLVHTGGAFALAGKNELNAVVDGLVDNHALRRRAGCAVARYVQQHAGATDSILSRLQLGSGDREEARD